jgi:hypothetical protein
MVNARTSDPVCLCIGPSAEVVRICRIERASPGEVADAARPWSSEAASTRCDGVSRSADLVLSRLLGRADSVMLSDEEGQG